jgi:N-methylhydantoinase A
MQRVAIDIGGTFTDVIGMDRDGQIHYTKVLTTYPDPTAGFFAGLRKLGHQEGTGRTEYLGHGTTLATNTLLTGTGAATALVTTRGFRDVLEIRRTHHRTLFDIYEEIPPPLVSRDARFEVSERVAADGSIVTPLDEGEVRAVARQIRDGDFGAVAICYLFSFVNPVHEQRTREILAQEIPGLADNIAVSSDILALHREYERTSTTAASAILMPLLRTYFAELEAQVRATTAAETLLIMQNTGGLVSPERAGDVPVLMLLSGPAGGATATAFFGGLWREKRLLALDMGGTSTDVSAVIDGVPDTRLDFQIGGYDISYPSIDIHTIGAGGGSIARVDAYGRLTVGPESARSVPGPACYGQGGELPTVTDANLVLGYLDAEQALGGEIRVDREAAERAIERYVARPLGLSVKEAARGIIAIVNSNMMHALRFISIERGRDPREFTLVPFGGAGPIHGADLAQELGIRRVLIPPAPGCTSALGILSADLRHELVRAVHAELTSIAAADLNCAVDEMRAQVREQLIAEGVERRNIRVTAAADIRYTGQAYELTIPLPARPRRDRATGDDGPRRDRATDEMLKHVTSRFHREHRRRYGHVLSDERVEIVNVRVSGVGLTSKPSFNGHQQAGYQSPGHPEGTRHALPTPIETPVPGVNHLHDAYLGDREIHLVAGEHVTVPVFDRARIGPGAALPAPSLITQLDATTNIPAGAQAVVDSSGSIVLELP